MTTVQELVPLVGVGAACDALAVPRSRFYRAQQPPCVKRAAGAPKAAPPRALSPDEKAVVRATLNSERFQDLAPREVYASLLDEGTYLCSWRGMYRILAENHELRERRNQLRHPLWVKPQLVASGPNQLWSWDITRLLTLVVGTFYYLYVVLDVYSRYVVGWLLAEQESTELAQQLISATCDKQGIRREQLTLHADHGGPMIAHSLEQLLSDLGVSKTHSRPHVSDDNPYSEAQFKTLKYRPNFPERFGSAPDARAWLQTFFGWYNDDHYHSGLGLLTPASVHYGQAPALLAARQEVLSLAYTAHPERFVKHPPAPEKPPAEVWINRPQPLLALPPPDVLH
jgi:putative transposase